MQPRQAKCACLGDRQANDKPLCKQGRVWTVRKHDLTRFATVDCIRHPSLFADPFNFTLMGIKRKNPPKKITAPFLFADALVRLTAWPWRMQLHPGARTRDRFSLFTAVPATSVRTAAVSDTCSAPAPCALLLVLLRSAARAWCPHPCCVWQRFPGRRALLGTPHTLTRLAGTLQSRKLCKTPLHRRRGRSNLARPVQNSMPRPSHGSLGQGWAQAGIHIVMSSVRRCVWRFHPQQLRCSEQLLPRDQQPSFSVPH